MEPNFIIELLSGEIPPQYQAFAANQLTNLFESNSTNFHFKIKFLKPFYSSQRIGFQANLEALKAENIKIIKGPKINQGEKAISAFLKKNLAKESNLNVEGEGIKSSYYLEFRTLLNNNTEDSKSNLSELILACLKAFKWKDVIHESANFNWIRPLYNILCIWQDDLIPLKFLSIESVDYTFGHRILTFDPKIGSQIQIKDIKVSTYFEQLLNIGKVLVDPEIRKGKILHECRLIPEFSNIQDNIQVVNLIDENIGICENPQVAVCNIPLHYLDLPIELISHVMAEHQRFIYLEGKNEKISEKFIVIIDHFVLTDSMRRGFIKVLCARLDDSKFYWNNDLEKSITEHKENLKILPFHANLGSIFDSLERISKIAQIIIDNQNLKGFENLQEFLEISKLDLAFTTTIEYPKLSGQLLIPYLKQKKELDSLEIFETIPPIIRKILQIAEKIDKLTGLILIAGEKTTGSFDPYGLRRTANELIELLRSSEIRTKIEIDLLNLVKNSSVQYHSFNTEDKTSQTMEVINFILDRIPSYIESYNHFPRSNLLFKFARDSYFKFYDSTRLNLVELLDYYDTLKKIFSKKEFLDLMIELNRVEKIVKKNQEIAKNSDLIFQTEEENELFQSTEHLKDSLARSSTLIEISEKLLNADITLRVTKAINNFLQKNLIEHEDIKIKNRRLELLNRVFRTFEDRFDFFELNQSSILF